MANKAIDRNIVIDMTHLKGYQIVICFCYTLRWIFYKRVSNINTHFRIVFTEHILLSITNIWTLDFCKI